MGMTQTSEAAKTTLTLSATYVTSQGKQYPASIYVSAALPTRQDADALVARFPKSVKLYAADLNGDPLNTARVRATIDLLGTTANGGVNETGLKRYRSILKSAAKLGITVDFKAHGCAPSYPTQEALEAAIA